MTCKPILLAIWTALTCGGCASYRFDLTRPAAVAGPVPRRFDLAPLRYDVRTAEGRLSIGVYNPTGETVRLVGTESAVVDPAGHSHPLIGQTIAADADVRVVLPPLRPSGGSAYVPVGGYGYGGFGPGVAVPVDGGGTDRADPVYWDWPGPGPVRVDLVYRRANGSRFTHELAFERTRK